MSKNLTIVVTGTIGSGKTTVCKFIKELGADYISSDEVAKDLIKNDPRVKRLIEYFLPHYGSKEFTLEIFKNPYKRAILNSIVHPFVLAYLREYKSRNDNNKVIEIPLFIETSAWDIADKIIVTYAPLEVLIKRIKERWNCPEEEAILRLSSQLSQEVKLKFAHYRIDTSISLEHTKRQVETIWKALIDV
jgi:dephospho-CoA kinase